MSKQELEERFINSESEYDIFFYIEIKIKRSLS